MTLQDDLFGFIMSTIQRNTIRMCNFLIRKLKKECEGGTNSSASLKKKQIYWPNELLFQRFPKYSLVAPIINSKCNTVKADVQHLQHMFLTILTSSLFLTPESSVFAPFLFQPYLCNSLSIFVIPNRMNRAAGLQREQAPVMSFLQNYQSSHSALQALQHLCAQGRRPKLGVRQVFI